jgi:hypothetical protein
MIFIPTQLAVEKFGEIALSVQDNWNFVNDESRMTPRESLLSETGGYGGCLYPCL